MADELLVEVVKILGPAVVGGGATYFWQHTIPKRQRQRHFVERLESELLFAAHDLQKRLYNFIELGGWVYIGVNQEEKKLNDLIPSTLYRIGQYLAYAVIWLDHEKVLRKAFGKKANDVFAKIGEISKGFSSDTDFSSQKLRLFKDNQDNFGESLIHGKGDQLSCLSLHEFLTRMDSLVPSEILDSIRKDLVDLKQDIPEKRTDRLVYLQNKLIDILDLLDPQKQRIRTDRDRSKGM